MIVKVPIYIRFMKGDADMEKSMNEIFSTNLRNVLYLAGKTQVELAKGIGISEVSVSNWINGNAVPRPNTVDKICAYLKCKREDLMIDKSQRVLLAPEDYLASEMTNHPELYDLFNSVLKMSSSDIELITALAKRILK